MVRMLSLPLTLLTAAHSISIYNPLCCTTDMTLTNYYITVVPSDSGERLRLASRTGKQKEELQWIE